LEGGWWGLEDFGTGRMVLDIICNRQAAFSLATYLVS
jgi:hypothetical protein